MINYQYFGDQNQNNWSTINCNKLLENEFAGVICVTVNGSTKIPFLVKPKYLDDSSSSTLECSRAPDQPHYLRALNDVDEVQTNQPKIGSQLEIEAQRCLNKLYSLHASDAEILGYVFELIENAFAEHDLLFVNALLANFDPNRTKLIISTGLLRVTSRAKSKLSSWKLCAARVSEFLNRRGENTKRLLRGLIRADDPIIFSTTTLS
jgi:hypothetical protein